MSVIVTNAKNRICYATVRSLCEKGIEVHAADSLTNAMTFYSKYTYDHFTYQSPFSNPDEFLKDVFKQAFRRKCKVIIPVYEETFLFAKYRDRLPDDIRMVLPSYENILTVHNKNRLYEVARNIGLRVPETYVLSDIDRDFLLAEKLTYPVIIKPCQGGGAWGVRKIESIQDLRRILDDHELPGRLPFDRFVVQDCIIGEVVCCAMLFNKGQFRAVHSYRQIREIPIAGGTATYRESVRDNQVIENCKTLLTYLNWHGICQTDFIVDKQTGNAYLIDVNPRLYGSLLLSIRSGVDFPHMLYKMATYGDIDPQYTFETGIRTRWLFGDIKCFLENIFTDKVHRKSLIDFFRRGEHEYFDEFDLHDLKPFFIWMYEYAASTVNQKIWNQKKHHVIDELWK